MNFTEMKNFMDRLTNWIIPGNTISVYHKNKEVFRYTSGFSDLENKVKTTGDELLFMYSCSKVATVVAALQLYEKGYFLMDDPLYAFIEEFRHMNVLTEYGTIRPAKSPITMRQLFTMTAGFSYNFDEGCMNEAAKKTGGKMNTVETIKCLAKAPLVYDPGTKWKYSLGHDILAAVVEIISGQKFSDYVKENIFEPIGVYDIHYHTKPKIEKRMARQYRFVNYNNNKNLVDAQTAGTYEEGYVKNIPLTNHLIFGPEYDSGGAGIIVSVPEYAKFANTLANSGLAPTKERILSSATVELLKTNQVTDAHRQCFNMPQLNGYGYGLGVRTLISKADGGSLSPIGEFGWGGAAGATVLVDTENQFSYVYAHHMLNPQETYYQPRLRNVAYNCFTS